MDFSPEDLLNMLALAPGLLFSLTIHEYAHARTAMAFGDRTAYYLGRVSLNPLRHLDPIGTLMLFLVNFGWAKPVPVNPSNLHPRGAADIAVSLAGPLTNLAFALTLGVALRAALLTPLLPQTPWADLLIVLVLLTIRINIVLCVFNLIPLFPLDGHHILREILPAGRRYGYMAWQVRYGRIALLALLFLPQWLGIPSALGVLFDQVVPPMMKALTGLTLTG